MAFSTMLFLALILTSSSHLMLNLVLPCLGAHLFVAQLDYESLRLLHEALLQHWVQNRIQLLFYVLYQQRLPARQAILCLYIKNTWNPMLLLSIEHQKPQHGCLSYKQAGRAIDCLGFEWLRPADL